MLELDVEDEYAETLNIMGLDTGWGGGGRFNSYTLCSTMGIHVFERNITLILIMTVKCI